MVLEWDWEQVEEELEASPKNHPIVLLFVLFLVAVVVVVVAVVVVVVVAIVVAGLETHPPFYATCDDSLVLACRLLFLIIFLYKYNKLLFAFGQYLQFDALVQLKSNKTACHLS